MRTLLLILLTSVLTAGTVTENYVKTSSIGKYYISFPENCNFSQPNTVIIGLHGPDSDGKEFNSIFDDIGGRDFIFVTPDGPYTRKDKKGKEYREWSLYTSKDSKLIFTGARTSSEFILDIIKDISERFRISNIYIMGFSYGASQAFLTGILNHEKFRGIISFGYGLKKNWFINNQIRSGSSLRVFLAHGKNDKLVAPSFSQKTYSVLKSEGYQVYYFEFDGDHEIPRNMLENLVIWLRE